MAKSDLDQDVASLLECGICLKEYNDPRALPCLHSFCLRCLKQHISATKDTDGSFRCSKCRNKFTPPEGDVEKFPKNSFLNSLKDVVTLTSKHPERPVVPTQCEAHKNNPDWYCQTGSAECMLRDHRLHETVGMTSIASRVEPDLLPMSKLAPKRVATLQNISSDLESRDMQTEIDKAQACREITKAAHGMQNPITECEKKALNKVKEARETFEELAANAKKTCDGLKTATSSRKMFEDPLKAAKSPPCTVLDTPIAKQEMLQQQGIGVPPVEWKMNRTSVKPGETSAGNVVGGVEMETSVEQEKTFQPENVILRPPLQITDLQYKGIFAVAGIAPIYGNMVCVAHYNDKFLWVYTGDGGLKRNVSIPEIEEIWGVVAVEGKRGKLAVVGATRKVHFVTLSADLEVQQHTTKDVPLVADRITMSGHRRLIVGETREKKFAVLPADGDEPLLRVQPDIPDERICLWSIVQTRVGYVICDGNNNKIYFTDRAGHTVHEVSTDWQWSQCVVVTSWGQILIADYWGHEIKVFSEMGDYLGRLRDNNRQTEYPQYIHIAEAEGLLYVVCGPGDARELRKYRLTAGSLPPLPITRSVTKMTVTLNPSDM